MVERLIAPDGRECLVGTPVEREQLLGQGYKRKAVEKPVVKPAVEPVKDETLLDVEADKPVRRTAK